MNFRPADPASFSAAAPPRPAAAAITRGVCRLLRDMGYAPLVELPLGNGRRVDVIGLDQQGGIVIVEVKSSPEDFRADRKWPDYLDHCDRFYFAVDPDFPTGILPSDHGVMVADAFAAAVLRPAPPRTVHGTRRRALTVRFARTAARRLFRGASGHGHSGTSCNTTMEWGLTP